ncbi:MAG: winged helix-turn-helix domain-containing protein [bacterium]|nr:winged helix-turn-helix domain-containing protein [bacterium]
MTDPKITELSFANQLGELTKLILKHRTELNKQLETKEFSKAKSTIDNIQLLLDIMTHLRTVEETLKQLEFGKTTVSVQVDENIIVRKKRGRKPKSDVTVIDGETPVVVPKKRGRKPKVVVATEGGVVVPAEPKKRGRKPKPKDETPKVYKKRGRKPMPKPEKVAGKRGRKPKSVVVAPYHAQKDYYRPILESLRIAGGSLTGTACLQKVRETMEMHEGDLEIIESTKSPRWMNVAPWARIKLVKCGLMKSDSPRALWEISEKGNEWLDGKLEMSLDDIDKARILQ